ncbi:MAG: nucleotidyltransferase domain-containing protein [Candidatus Methanofastidiosia archaeon]
MINPSYLNVLRKIYMRLSSTDVKWAVTGSLNFALQGIDITPNDIDIQTDKEGAYKIERYFSNFVIKKIIFSSSERIRSHFGALMIDGIKVEIMGDVQKWLEDETWEVPVDLELHKRIVELEGMHVLVLSLEYEYQAYQKLGRIHRAMLLKQWLHDRHG